MVNDLNIVNARLWLEDGLHEASLSVQDGRITRIGAPSKLPRADRTVDAAGNLVIPGLVDLHVHFREPGQTQKEDFQTGTSAAAAGGVTTVVDEPNNIPVTSSVQALNAKRRLVEGKALVDYTFSLAPNAGSLEDINEARRAGYSAFTIFDELGGSPTGMADTGVLHEALGRIKEVDGVAFLNCRESDLVQRTARRLRAQGRNTLRDYMSHFPHVAESVGAAKRVLLAASLGVKAHLREVSTRETVEALQQLKPYMGAVSAEVRPDHLFLTIEDTGDLGPYAQQWTPLRTRGDAASLWQALRDGTVNVIASDHATHTREEKEPGWSDIWQSPPGLPAIESMLPLLLTRVNMGGLSLSTLVEAASANPARVLGVYPRKGCIRVGSDADLVIVDMKKVNTIRGEESLAKNKWTPYEGWKVKGAPVATFVRGVETFRDGVMVADPGSGEFLKLL